VSQALDVEAELKRDTVGLVHLDEFQRRREQLELEKQRKLEEAARKAKLGAVAGKIKKKSLVDKGKLSFDDDLEGEGGDFTAMKSNKSKSSKNKAVSLENGGENGEEPADLELPFKKKPKKDPTIDTSFLPDKERETKERELREQLKQEWLSQQEAIKQEEIRVDVSYWDGSGHAGSVVVWNKKAMNGAWIC
jgi:protein FAM50